MKYHSGSTNQISVSPTQPSIVKLQSDWSFTYLDTTSYVATCLVPLVNVRMVEPGVFDLLVSPGWFAATSKNEAENKQEDGKPLSII